MPFDMSRDGGGGGCYHCNGNGILIDVVPCLRHPLRHTMTGPVFGNVLTKTPCPACHPVLCEDRKLCPICAGTRVQLVELVWACCEQDAFKSLGMMGPCFGSAHERG